MKTLFTLLLFAIAIVHGQAQTCTGYFEFNSQTQVDNFLSENPSCVEIDGTVIIYNYDEGDPIWNFDAFSNIVSISENLEIYHNMSNSLDFSGFSNLETISGMLLISEYANEPWISDLSPFQNITSLSALYLENLRAMTTLSAFDGITTLQGLTLKGQFDLLTGPLFPNLTAVNGDITFEAFGISLLHGFDALQSANQINFNYGENWFWNIAPFDIDAFHNITTLNNLFFIETSLNSIQGFESLTECGAITLDILTNFDLPDFPALTTNTSISIIGMALSTPEFPSLHENSSITIIGNYPTVQLTGIQIVNDVLSISADATTGNSTVTLDLPQLTTLNGDLYLTNLLIDDLNMPNVSTITGTLNINYCPNLIICNYNWVCQKIAEQPELVTLENNGEGCNTIEEISSNCGQSSIQGMVFADINCDGTFNEGDVAINHPVLLNENGEPFGASSSTGQFFIPVEQMTTYTFSPQNIPGTLAVDPLVITTGATTTVYDNNFFALCAEPNYLGATSACSFWNMRPGFNASMYFTIQNTSFNTETVSLNAAISILPNLDVLSSTWPYTISGSTLTFDDLTLLPNEVVTITLIATVEPSLPIGTPFTIGLTVDLISPAGSFYTNNPVYNGTITGSYDPNDIMVDRTAINHDEMEASGEWLQYQIRFQNTGNAPAEFINVINEQDLALDMSTLQIIGASHDYALSFNGREMTWFFDNIQLPDSTSDPLGSQGFILFRIKTNPGVSLDEIIESTAAIYFDYNVPVITNTATTVFYTCPEALSISGNTNYCDGDVVALEATANYDSYNWLLDGQIIGLNQDFNMTLTTGVYNLSVEGSSLYCQSSNDINIVVNAIPDTPSIMNDGNTLYASGSGTFNWTFNGNPLTETGNTLEITESGTYGVSVTENGCTSGTSQNNFTYIFVDENKLDGMLIYPNPCINTITVQLPTAAREIRIFDISGKLIYTKTVSSTLFELDLSLLESGYYIMECLTTHEKLDRPFVKE